MSDYTKTTDFAAKDALASGNPAKVIVGTELDDEFNAIATAIATKANSDTPSYTGTATFEDILIADEFASTNTVVNLFTIRRTSSGTPATGIGAGWDVEVETVAGNEIGAEFEVVTTDVTSGSEDFDFVIKLMAAGAAAAEVIRFTSAGQVILGSGTFDDFLDEDNMASDSASALASQQSIKAYVDSSVAGLSTDLADALAADNATDGNDIVVTAGDVITTDTINETTGASGVTIDSLLVKDGAVSFDSGTNFLDDYEEGTFTPGISDGSNSATLSTALGEYTKIGNTVFFTAEIVVSSIGSMSGVVRMTGLPFANNGANNSVAIIGGAVSSLNITAGQSLVGDLPNVGSTNCNIYKWDETGGTSGLTESELSNGAGFTISGKYETNS